MNEAQLCGEGGCKAKSLAKHILRFNLGSRSEDVILKLNAVPSF